MKLFGQCANYFCFSSGKYTKIEQISSTLTGFNTGLEERPICYHFKRHHVNMTLFTISYQGQWCTQKVLHKTWKCTSALFYGDVYFSMHNLHYFDMMYSSFLANCPHRHLFINRFINYLFIIDMFPVINWLIDPDSIHYFSIGLIFFLRLAICVNYITYLYRLAFLSIFFYKSLLHFPTGIRM